MRNVEIKAKLQDINVICKIAEELSGSGPKLIKQDDTFYKVNHGRLKLRLYEDGSATLVQYNRYDGKEPKLSDYQVLNFASNESEKIQQLDDILKISLGAFGRVVKNRLLYMVGQTRIHIDTVEGLGHFMELEVVLEPKQTLEDGYVIAKDLQVKLGVRDEDLISCAYVDLLNKNK